MPRNRILFVRAFTIALAWTILIASGGCRRSSERSINVPAAILEQLVAKFPGPEYPATALSRNMSGVVVARFAVEVDGTVGRIRLLESPDAALGRAVIAAITRWHFAPFRSGDEATVAIATISFRFDSNLGMVTRLGTPRAPVTVLPPRWIESTEFAKLLTVGDAIFLDIRTRKEYRRAHRDGFINVPLDELRARGPIELASTTTAVLACHRSVDVGCSEAVRLMRTLGVPTTLLLAID